MSKSNLLAGLEHMKQMLINANNIGRAWKKPNRQSELPASRVTCLPCPCLSLYRISFMGSNAISASAPTRLVWIQSQSMFFHLCCTNFARTGNLGCILWASLSAKEYTCPARISAAYLDLCGAPIIASHIYSILLGCWIISYRYILQASP